MAPLPDRALLHLADCLLRPLDHPAHYYLEVIEGATRLHSRDSRPLIDARALGELAPLLAPHGFRTEHRFWKPTAFDGLLKLMLTSPTLNGASRPQQSWEI